MITQIRIDGFKSFRDFRLDVPPTLVMLGANGAGKSNLLDALRLVAGTADRGFEETVRGDRRLAPVDLFRRHKGGERRELTVTVGSLVATRYGPVPLRIRLVVARLGSGRVMLGAKSGVWISSLREPGWMGDIGLDEDQRSAVARARAEFATHDAATWVPFQGPLGSPLPVEDEESVRSSARSEALFEEPGTELRLLAARECASWTALVLDPAAMRLPSPAFVERRLAPDGRNLAEVLQRIEERPPLWRRFVADLAALVDGVDDVRVVYDERRQEYDFEVSFSNTGWLAPPALSDGTLRMAALLAAAADPAWPGGMCVEEIENGMNPEYVAELVRRLRRGTGVRPEASAYRQLIATTHSPALLAALRHDLSGSLVFLEQADRVDPADGTISRATVARPLRAFDPEREPGESVSPERVERLLRKLNGAGE
ncbi:AAA family ATPase [Streptomyces sp. NPDC048659]|uniref:AAA family ATPase n=1 Tax=Streptomyces sp. NPDC048659 TaxID=3155489 RepID=UPI0034191144